METIRNEEHLVIVSKLQKLSLSFSLYLIYQLARKVKMMKDNYYSNQLKTHQDNSSNRIDKLYQEFQDLKVRIRKNSYQSKQSSVDLPPQKVNPNLQDLNEKSQQNYIIKNPQIKSYFCQPTFLMPSSEMNQNYLKKEEEDYKENLREFMVNMQEKVGEAQRLIHKKVGTLDNKLKMCQEIIKNIHKLNNFKKSCRQSLKNNQISQKKEYSNKEDSRSQSLIKVVSLYQEKITQMAQQYQEKLRRMEKNSAKETSSTVNFSSTKDMNDFEQLLLAKDHMIGELRLQNSKLRRINSKNEVQIMQNQQMIKDLKGQMNSNKSSSTKTDCLVQTEELQSCPHTEALPYQQSEVDLNGSPSIKEDLNCSIQNDLDEDFHISKQNIYISQNFEPEYKRKKLQEMKTLLVEFDLIQEENKHLEWKKRFFEMEQQNNEKDEQLFLQQSITLKEEIRDLSVNIKLLDEVAISLLNGKKIQKTTVEQLREDIEFKKIYKKFTT